MRERLHACAQVWRNPTVTEFPGGHELPNNYLKAELMADIRSLIATHLAL